MLFQPENFLILVVDDLHINLELIVTVLDLAGYEVTFVDSGEEALARINKIKPDLIILDLMMPGMTGLQLCDRLQQNSETREIPVIFLTASNEQDHLLQAFELGAVDYVTKPFNHPELLARVKLHLELKQTKDQLQQAIKEQNQLIKQLEKLAITDSLTGIYNRRHLFYLAEQELSRVRRYRYPFSVLILDIDYFKQINDHYGHHSGDQALKIVANIVTNSLREGDYFGRFGGEEFVVFLPQTNLKQAEEVGERIRYLISEMSLSLSEESLQITISIGIASYNSQDQTIDQMLHRADQALYQAKNQGRNRVVVYGN